MSGSVSIPSRPAARPLALSPRLLILGALFAVAVFFVSTYVLHYYLHYSAAGFQRYWPQPRRAALLIHISGGTIALLSGPWQFSTRLRQRSLRFHRILGRSYLIAIALASLASFVLAATSSFGWAWSFALAVLGFAWLTTSSVAFYAIRRRKVQLHKEWMIRSYIVTFGFVLFRLLTDFGPTSRLQPVMDLNVTAVWACWAIPLLIGEIVLGIRHAGAPRGHHLPS